MYQNKSNTRLKKKAKSSNQKCKIYHSQHLIRNYRHTKKKEGNMIHNAEKNQSIGTDLEMTKMELTEREVKRAITNIFHIFKMVKHNMMTKEMEGTDRQNGIFRDEKGSNSTLDAAKDQ